MDSVQIELAWHFLDEDVQDLPSTFAPGPKMPEGVPLPAAHDLVRFAALPGVSFMVQFRELVYTNDPSRPVELHAHLKRLPPTSA